MKCWNYLTMAALMTFALQAATPNPAVAAPPDKTVSEVYSFDPEDDEVKGFSMLSRTDDGVSMVLATTDLAPGAYSVWWAINPTPAGGFPLGIATSQVVGPNGEATFAASLKEGPLSQRGTFEDARSDVIHLVVRYHGPVDPTRLREQLGSFEAGVAVNVQFSPHDPLPLD